MDYFFQLLGVVFTHQVQKNISNHIAQLISIGGEGYPQSVAGFHLWWSLPPHPGPLPRNGGEGRVRGFAWKMSAILRLSLLAMPVRPFTPTPFPPRSCEKIRMRRKIAIHA